MNTSAIVRRYVQIICFVAVSMMQLFYAPAFAQIYQCKDGAGRTTFQQRPCDGEGRKLEVRPANAEVSEPARPTAQATPPTPQPPADKQKAQPRDDLPNAYQDPRHGLTVGLDTRGVVERWGLPTSMRSNRNWSYMHWCDGRMVLMVDGKLARWLALEDDAKIGAHLFKYGEPWIAAAQRWGTDRKIEPFSGPLLGRGETHRWSPNRWVVTDSHGNIVGWCDASKGWPSDIPPAFNPPWDNALAK